MKNKIVWGSVVVALLMLVSTQIVFLDTVKSWPSMHEGDADAGHLWVSELNTSSVLTNVKNVGIGHANATHDWVLWTRETGSIRVDWTVDIGDKHPEYFVIFMLHVFNIDDNCSEMGNSTRVKTYNANTSYYEYGDLQVSAYFSPSFLSNHSNATLVCYLDTIVIVNNTAEAVNFTCWGQDRCVVAVDFENPMGVPEFSDYVDESNEMWPSMWSWFSGWDEGGKFGDECDMLTNQTYFSTGSEEASSSGETDWLMGQLEIKLKRYVLWEVEEWTRLYGNFEVSSDSPEYFQIGCKIKVIVTGNNLWTEYWKGLPVRHLVKKTLGSSVMENSPLWWCDSGTSYPSNNLRLVKSWADMYNIIYLTSYIWVGFAAFPILDDYNPSYTVTLTGDNEMGGYTGGSDEHFWKDSCVYQNNSFDVDASSGTSNGITTVEATISEVIQSNNEIIYSFAADRGDTRVDFTV